MANITLKVDDALLEKARRLAFRRNTSVNAVVRKRLEEFVASDLQREIVLEGLSAFFEKTRAQKGRRVWTREDLHER